MFKFPPSVEKKPDDMSKDIVYHLSQTKTEIMHYFPDVVSCAFSINPFFIDLTDVLLGSGEQEELIDIQTDETAKIKHKECCPINFRLSMVSWHPNLARHAVSQLLIFPSAWECEQKFDDLQSKIRNRLAAPEHDFRCAASATISRVDQLVEKKQLHPFY